MKTQWKKEQRMCSSCHDKPAMAHRHGYGRSHEVPLNDFCPRCARDFENKVMAHVMAESAKVIEFRFDRPVEQAGVGDVAVAAAV